MSRYLVYDLEVENNTTYRRFCNPFDSKNYVVARGWKHQGDAACSWEYFKSATPDSYLKIADDVTMLVGHNIKFDLMFEWNSPDMRAFFKRGGRIWDTQYVEYLIEGMHEGVHLASMDSIIEKYGGRKKIDAVKALWNAGVKTSGIDQDLLIDYLVGTVEEGRNSGDVGNTEMIFLQQVTKVRQLNMMPMVLARMDGLCATTEMEYNGLKIDVQEARRKMEILKDRLKVIEDELQQYIPINLPDELEFNWASNHHRSAIIFGGAIGYSAKAPYIDPKTGELARKQEKVTLPLYKGQTSTWDSGLEFDTFTSGKKKGAIRTKTVTVPGELKERFQDHVYHFKGYVAPKQKWATASTDAVGKPIYSTTEDTIEELATLDIPFLKLIGERQTITKDLGTYYVRHNGKEYKGMLTCVLPWNHIIHHNLNHTQTVTSRLSSDNPNMQNIPKADNSEVKKMFISRFKDGLMLEADYSQLEVVVQAMLSNDLNLIKDLNSGVDFHCKRVSHWKGITYEEAVLRCKDPAYPDHAEWKGYRTKAKVFSFQRAYGAGAKKIAETTGMALEDIEALIAAEEAMYPSIPKFNARVEAAVNNSAEPFRDPVRGNKVYRRGRWQSPTGTIYSWRSWDAPKFKQDRGIRETFKPTEIKNYPTQGTGGEIVQIICGLLWRHFVANDNYNGRVFICNTVHDSVWFDAQKDAVPEAAGDIKRIMESVPETLERLYKFKVPVKFPVEIEAGTNMYNKALIKH